MKKTFKFMSLLLTVLVMGVAFSACSSDDSEPAQTFGDWYMECASVTGGGLSSQECASWLNAMNNTSYYYNGKEYDMGPGLTYTGWDRDVITYQFDKAMEFYAAVWGLLVEDRDVTVKGTLNVVFVLKTKAGATVKTSTLAVTSSGVTIK